MTPYFIGTAAGAVTREVESENVLDAFRTLPAGMHLYCRWTPGRVAPVAALTPALRPLYRLPCGRFSTLPE